MNIRRNTTHLIMDGRYHGNRLLGDINVGKVMANLEYAGQALHDGLRAQVRHIEHHVIFVRAAASSFFDFLVHAARDEIARRQIFQRGGIALHKALTVAVAQYRPFAPTTFGQQHPGACNAGGVELPKLHVFQWQPRTCSHSQAIAGVDKRIGAGGEYSPSAASSQQHALGF